MSWFGRREHRDPPEQAGERGLPDAEDWAHAQAEEFLDLPEVAPARAALDFTTTSLDALDEVVGRFHDRGQAPQAVLIGAACYLMEVARAVHGGVYQDAGHDDPLVLVVEHGRGRVGMLAMSKVRGRVRNGTEDDLAFFYRGFAAAVRDQRSATIF